MSAVDYAAELDGAFDAAAEQLTVPEPWAGMPGMAFGGFVVGAMLAAAAKRAHGLRPLAVHARFHRPVPLMRPVGLSIELEHRGRNLEAYRASAVDGGSALVTSCATFGRDLATDLASQHPPPMTSPPDPTPVWRDFEQAKLPVPAFMRRLAFRRAEGSDPRAHAPWHVMHDWPAPGRDSLTLRAAAALMCVDTFVPVATMVANGAAHMPPWPAFALSLDLAVWFHHLDAQAHGEDATTTGRLGVRTAVSATRGGYAVGRTEVWAANCLVAEGTSQVMLIAAA